MDEERIKRQLLALRQAARCRTHFAHDKTYRAAFVRGLLACVVSFGNSNRSRRLDRTHGELEWI